MKMVLVLILFGSVSFDTVLAQPPKPASQDPGVADTIKQLEQNWADAMTVVDIPKLSQIVADDWISGYPGKTSTKANFLDDVKSGKHKLEACEFGPREVKVLGDVAVLQGSVTETRIADGQRSTFRVAYMDVWVKRGDRWVVVRSYATKL
ncbi:MAG TPA: nuclear transport factor 2 family protein [Kofleriaceae bacterium]|nr:nuclear transport factor 2 family protein [Kofleriaceae bacterium]